MRVRVINASIADVSAEALCTSTNPRLSLYEGTGGAIREKGGWEIKRECEAILESERARTGDSELRVGSVHSTTAGKLAARAVLHCVASDAMHRSSREIVAACTGNALAKASVAGYSTIAMPVFATGHAAFRFESAVEAMAEAIVESSGKAGVDEVTIAVLDEADVARARQILRRSTGTTTGLVIEGDE